MTKAKRRRASPESPELGFIGILKDQFDKTHGYLGLAKAISKANGARASDPDVVDRRKLKKILEHDPELVLKVSELAALDRYLEPLGHGLAYNPLFLRSNLLQSIASAGKPVTFLLGSRRFDEIRLSHDHWDVRALAQIQRGVGSFAPEVRFDIRDVLLHEDLGGARYSVEKGKWTKLLADDGPSLVFLGTNRATHTTELALSRMFGVEPFDAGSKDKRSLPFHFAWARDVEDVYASAFHYTADELRAIDPRAARAVAESRASALEADGRVYLDRVKQKRQNERGASLGVCVAQRRPGGQVWMVLAGITGPATYAAARVASRLELNLTDDGGRVYWTAVYGTVHRDANRTSGTFLALKDEGAVGKVMSWPPGD